MEPPPNRSVVTRRAVWLIVIAALVVGAYRWCVIDWLLLADKRAFNAMKNRTSLPGAVALEGGATLEALVAPGDDRHRWSQDRAAIIEGFVIRVHDAGPESANCFSLRRVDTHIEIATRIDAPPRERLVVEVTPPMREWATRHAMDWTTPTLQRTLTGQHVRIGGWLLFDDEHDEESETTHPGSAGNWRATAWEIHPVTSIEVLHEAARLRLPRVIHFGPSR